MQTVNLTAKKKAFSLVELVVVITILSVLATISTVSYIQYALDGRNSARMTDLGQIKIALQSAKQKTGSYPLPGKYFTITNS